MMGLKCRAGPCQRFPAYLGIGWVCSSLEVVFCIISVIMVVELEYSLYYHGKSLCVTTVKLNLLHRVQTNALIIAYRGQDLKCHEGNSHHLDNQVTNHTALIVCS